MQKTSAALPDIPAQRIRVIFRQLAKEGVLVKTDSHKPYTVVQVSKADDYESAHSDRSLPFRAKHDSDDAGAVVPIAHAEPKDGRGASHRVGPVSTPAVDAQSEDQFARRARQMLAQAVVFVLETSQKEFLTKSSIAKSLKLSRPMVEAILKKLEAEDILGESISGRGTSVAAAKPKR